MLGKTALQQQQRVDDITVAFQLTWVAIGTEIRIAKQRHVA